GLFTSPAINDFREHIRVCGVCIEDAALVSLTERVRAAAGSMDDHPTHYELLTALAMLYFAAQQCDIVVLETALGGTDDCTNVIDAPLAAVLTAISLEHTQILGSTLSEIASAKAGIIKRGSSVVCCENDLAVMEVVQRRCAEVGAPLRTASGRGRTV
ncbi:MAG: bifunctional folylpolyglutamate synthase/dihydrofolate synthase, partial [Clostridia bacterium]|nr:bifunctional folylpolyglutamate synthase/dihydrofolate synthase [Clostridia bacterium]